MHVIAFNPFPQYCEVRALTLINIYYPSLLFMPILFLFLLKLHFYSAVETSCRKDLPLGPAHWLPDGPSQVAGRGRPSHARKNCVSHSGSGHEALWQAPQRPAKMGMLCLLK